MKFITGFISGMFGFGMLIAIGASKDKDTNDCFIRIIQAMRPKS